MKTFFHILGNTLIASVTNFTVWFALVFFVYLETRSVFATGIISGLYLAAVALSGFWLGGLVDHHKKKTMMLFSSLISLVAYIAGFALYLSVPLQSFNSPSNSILWVFVVLLMIGVVVGNIRTIALPTLVTIMVPEDRRDRANGLVGTTSGISFLITSVISGFLVGLAGMYWVLILAIVLTLAALVHLWFLPVPELVTTPSEQENTRSLDIRGTFNIILGIPGFLALILFTTFNNFLGGVFMSLMDAYGLSLVSVQVWGLIWGVLSTGFIFGGLLIAKVGLGKNPLRALFTANIIIWIISSLFTIQPSIVLLSLGMFIYLCVVPYIEAAEHTIIQKVIPPERQGRVFGFAQSVEQAASPLTSFLIGPITQFVFIPFMTDGAGAASIGGWFGTGPDRGIALVFTLTGIIGLVVTLIARNSRSTKLLSRVYDKS